MNKNLEHKSLDYKNKKLMIKRIEKGYSMQDVADILGVTRQRYSYWENQKTGITLMNIKKLLDIFDCKFEDIF